MRPCDGHKKNSREQEKEHRCTQERKKNDDF